MMLRSNRYGSVSPASRNACSTGLPLVIDAVILPPEPEPEAKDIVDTAVAAGDFNTLAKALTAAGLVDTLKGEGPFTVFAPTDEAFAALPAGTVESLLEKIEPYRHSVSTCDRCEQVIEPLASQQWFVKMAPLAGPAIAAVAMARRGRSR